MDSEPLPSTAAVVLAGAPGLPPPTTQYPEPDSDDDSEDDADDALLPPGPVDPDRCTVRLAGGICCRYNGGFTTFAHLERGSTPLSRLRRRFRGLATPAGLLSQLSRSSSPPKMRPESASARAGPISRCIFPPPACAPPTHLHARLVPDLLLCDSPPAVLISRLLPRRSVSSRARMPSPTAPPSPSSLLATTATALTRRHTP